MSERYLKVTNTPNMSTKQIMTKYILGERAWLQEDNDIFDQTTLLGVSDLLSKFARDPESSSNFSAKFAPCTAAR